MSAPEYRVEVFLPKDWAMDGNAVAARLNALAVDGGWRVVGPPVAVGVDGVDRLVYTLERSGPPKGRAAGF